MDKITSWTSRIDHLSAAYKKEFGSLSTSELNWKPSQQVWSIAQVLDHLISINLSYLPVVEYAATKNYKLPFTARIPGIPGFIGRAILKSVHPDNRRKSRSLTVWQPSSGNLPGDILQRFLENQDQLKNLIIRSEPLLERRTIISSPASRHIVYSLEDAFEIIVTHEERHLRQALEIKELLKK